MPVQLVRRRRPRPDQLLRILLANAAIGGALGLIFVGGVLWLDLGHVRSLAFASSDGWLAIALLAVGSIVTFASVVMGGAIMLMPKSDDEPPKATRQPTGLALARAAASAAQTRHKA